MPTDLIKLYSICRYLFPKEGAKKCLEIARDVFTYDPDYATYISWNMGKGVLRSFLQTKPIAL